MVQGRFNPEYYIGQVSTNDNKAATTKYRDSLPPDVEKVPDVQDLKVARSMWERIPIKCVEIPGETEWSKEQYAALAPQVDACTTAQDASTPASLARKRHLGDPAEAPDADSAGISTAEQAQTGSPALRRRHLVKGVRSAEESSGSRQGNGAAALTDETAQTASEAKSGVADADNTGLEDDDDGGDDGEGEDGRERRLLGGLGPRVEGNVLITSTGAHLVFDSYEDAVGALNKGTAREWEEHAQVCLQHAKKRASWMSVITLKRDFAN